MHYYVDGYNLMFRFLHVNGDLSDEREYIIYDLSKKAHTLNLNMTLVFDAHYQFGEGSRSHFRNVEIVFTQHGETADEYILNALKHPRRETVVTSDKKLAQLARHAGAKTETIEAFISWVSKRYAKKPNKKKEDVPTVHKPPRRTLSDFDRWLKIFEERMKDFGA